MNQLIKHISLIGMLIGSFTACGPNTNSKDGGNRGALSGNVAEKVYVAPGEHDSHYAFISGGFSGQLSVYGLPSGRLFRVIPFF